MQSQPWRAWKLGLTTSHMSQFLSPKRDMDAYVATLLGSEARNFVLRVESSKKLDLILNTNLANSFA